MELARGIHDKALELGYVACGIVRAEDMRGYTEVLERRTDRFPETKGYLTYFGKFARPEEEAPWAKSIIVCAGRYGKYRIPKEVQGRIGKYYLTDYRVMPESKEYRAAGFFDELLTQKGIRFAKDTMRGGITASRYAAMKAGIGIVRKNNLLYTEFGSWVWLETWLIDRELEYCEPSRLEPCPEGCTRCVDACETGALAEPYQTNIFTCTTMQTWGGLPNTLPREAMRPKMKGWLYGCDDCQDCCPMNRGRWTEEEEMPGLEEICQTVSLEQLCALDDETLAERLSPWFFYIRPEAIWKWKIHALRAMAYAYKSEYLPHMQAALRDERELIREMARWALEATEGSR